MKKLTEVTQNYNNMVRPIIERTEGRNVVASVSHVSKSGLTRWIDVYIDNGECYTGAVPYIAETLHVSCELEWGKRGVRIQGVGTDMIFKMLYDYYRAIGIPQPIALNYANNYQRN